MKRFLPALFALLVIPATAALAWDGYDPATNAKVEITTKKSKVKKGATIEIYDHKTEKYHDVEVDNMKSEGKYIRFDVYDVDTGKERVLMMEGFTKKSQEN